MSNFVALVTLTSMKKLLTATFIAFFAIHSFAQKGDFLLKHHLPTHASIDNANFEVVSDNNGVICLANRAGVLKYDGDTWDYFPTPSAALSLAVDSENVIYVGSINTFGKIDFDRNTTSFQPLIETDTINDLFLQTQFFQGKVYFLGSQYLGIYDIEREEVQLKKGSFINMFQIGDELFINSSEETFSIENDSLNKRDLGIQVSSASNYDNKPPLLVDYEGELFVWDERAKTIKHNELIAEQGYEINEAKWINDSLIACSTFSDGVIFLNYNDTNYMEVTDYHSGLPDNEIYALHTDNSGEVWIAHPFGLTSVSPLFPAFSYSNFPGLTGNLTGIFQNKGKLWVTTSLGLFHFDRDTTFKNQVYYKKVVTKKKRATKEKATKSKTVKSKEKKARPRNLIWKRNRVKTNQKDGIVTLKSETKDKKQKMVFLNSETKNKKDKKALLKSTTEDQKEKKAFLKLKTDGQKEKKGFFKAIVKGVEDLFDNPDNVDRVSGKLDKNVKYERRVRKVPIKVSYLFAQVEGTDGKFFDIIEYNDKLLGVGKSGIYEIAEEASELVIAENVRSVTTTSTGQLLVSTSDLELKSFKLTDNIWVEQTSQHVDDIIVNMQEDSKGKIWLAGSSNLYNISLTDSTLVFSNTYALSNQFLDDVDIIEKEDTVYFINSQGYFFYDTEGDKIAENTSLKNRIGLAKSSLSEPSNKSVWIYNGKSWYLIPSQGAIQQFDYMGLFTDLIAISKDLNSNQYWLLTRGNELLKYDPEKSRDLASYQLFVKKLTNQKGDIDGAQKFSLAYDENFLTVELSKPDFLGLLNPEFQYLLTGLHTEWSEWSKSKSIDFSFLPAGQYQLQVRSKDAFGEVEQATMLDFTVKSPYWQRPWFYALQIIFFGTLVIVSSRLNQSKSQYRLISGALSVLTLVLIIEFIQSAAAAFLDIQSTPVVDFALDVFVALLIFPLEQFLRQFLSHGKVDVKIIEKVKSKRKKKKLSAESD